MQAAIFFALGTVKYAGHRNLVDFGLFTQTIASATSTFSNTFESGSHWAFHFSPILYLCAPIVALTHSGLALTAIQAVAGAIVAPPLYLIARRRASERVALGIALIGLIYPPLAGLEFADFHENALVPGATMWLLWAIDARRWRVAIALVTVVLAIKEDQALIVGFLGAALYLGTRRSERPDDRAARRFALVAIALCAVAFSAYFGLIRPQVAAGTIWSPARFYRWTLDDLSTIGLHTLPDRLGYLALVFVPLVLIPLRSPAVLFALPGLAECLLAREPAPYSMGQHYAAVWIPYVLFAFALAAPQVTGRLLAISASLCVLVYVVANPLHPGYFLRPYSTADARLDRFLAKLPAQIEMGTQEEAYTHLGFDARAQLGLGGGPRYALFDRDFADSVWLRFCAQPLADALDAGQYRLIERDGGIDFYERVDPPVSPVRAPPTQVALPASWSASACTADSTRNIKRS